MIQELYCSKYILEDLKKKMVFWGGPRQVGKTTLSKKLIEDYFKQGEYFNWDFGQDREALLKQQWKIDSPLIIFDELHKYPHWKQWIKGTYDVKPSDQQYMVTGSARLDVYKQGGDSLMGRYHYWRLHPLTLDEHPHELSKHTVQLVGNLKRSFGSDGIRVTTPIEYFSAPLWGE